MGNRIVIAAELRRKANEWNEEAELRFNQLVNGWIDDLIFGVDIRRRCILLSEFSLLFSFAMFCGQGPFKRITGETPNSTDDMEKAAKYGLCLAGASFAVGIGFNILFPLTRAAYRLVTFELI